MKLDTTELLMTRQKQRTRTKYKNALIKIHLDIQQAGLFIRPVKVLMPVQFSVLFEYFHLVKL